MRRGLLAVGSGLAVAALLGGWGQPRPSGTEQPEAARAVRAIGAGSPRTATVPAGFTTAMGYRPVVGGPAGAPAATRPDGGCTSPFGSTRYGFGAACRQHDFGYDLLRYAAATGRPLGGWARRAIDDRFAAQLRERCEQPACRLAADTYASAARLNSLRQGWGVPVVESAGAIALPALSGLLAMVVLGSATLTRRAGRLAGRVLDGMRGQHLAAGAGLALGLQPLMLPRPLWAQALIGGFLAVHGYAAAVLAGRLGLVRLPLPRLDITARRAALLGVLVAGIGVLVAAQVRVLAATGAAPAPGAALGSVLLAAVAAAAVAALLLGLARLGRTAAGLLGRVARTEPLRRRVAVGALVPVLVLVLGGATARADALPAAAVPGPTGAEFLAGAPDEATIGQVTGRPARTPLRVYVGTAAAPGPRPRAELAAQQLERAGGLDREVVLLAVPTGSGWVNPAAVGALEYLHAGDTATVAVQYSAVPSWVAYLQGGDGVRASVRELLGAVARRLEHRPRTDRPRLLVYGESLGAWGGLSAYPAADGVATRTDGALWAGLPAGAPATGTEAGRVLVHPDDPVRAWSPSLLVRPSPAWPHRWLPVATFWQVTGDVLAARLAPSGHGHRYGPELLDAWRSIAPPASPPDPARLTAVRMAVAGLS